MARRLRLVVGETDGVFVAEAVVEALKELDVDVDADTDPDPDTDTDPVTEREELEETVGKLE